MKLLLLAAESMGVRSMASVIDTKEGRICIDPAAALGPSRFGQPPHPQEEKALKEAINSIEMASQNASYIVITHYHFDHHLPERNLYQGKTIFAKDINEHINKSQQQRGKTFCNRWSGECNIVYCDDSIHSLGRVKLCFSPPFPHGPPGTRLGYTIMVTAIEDKTILFSSDVQGPVDYHAAQYIIKQHPDIIIVDGPPTYLLGWRFSQKNLRKAEHHLMKIMEQTDSRLILDHHLLRDLGYKTKLQNLYQRFGDRIQTFAEFNGRKNNLLEANRKKLWQKRL